MESIRKSHSSFKMKLFNSLYTPSTVFLIVTGFLAASYISKSKVADNPENNPASVEKLGLIHSVVPPGAILAYGGQALPTGFLWCNGDSVPRSKYPELFAAIGTSWGYPIGDTSKFCLPDLRGLFLRGVDPSESRDPDASKRTASREGGNTGNAVGTFEEDMFKEHNHKDSTFADQAHQHWLPIGSAKNEGSIWSSDPEKWGTRVVNDGGNSVGAFYAAHGPRRESMSDKPNKTATVTPEGGKETRPKNVSVNYIIKF
jgi:microcystin-dependent protein